MIANWSRHSLHVLACTALVLLAGCGSGTIESALKPTRFLAVGDAFSDLGQSGTRYTVNGDPGVKNWTEQLAAQYGLSITPSSAGGLSYARAHARVVSAVDAVGGNAASISAQVTALLAGSPLGANDVVLIQGGLSDIIAQMASTPDATTRTANVKQAGRDLGAQVRRLVAGGAKQVLMAGVYNLGQSPWALGTSQRDVFRELSDQFNQGLLVSVEDLGGNVLYLDAAFQFNLMTATPASFGLLDAANLLNSTTPVTPVLACASVDAGVGIGTGLGQVNSGLCSTTTLTSGIDYNTRLFADRVHFTPVGQRLFGDYAFSRLRTRW